VLIHQDARLYAGLFDGNEQAMLEFGLNRRSYVHVARGEVRVNGTALSAGDCAQDHGCDGGGHRRRPQRRGAGIRFAKRTPLREDRGTRDSARRRERRNPRLTYMQLTDFIRRTSPFGTIVVLAVAALWPIVDPLGGAPIYSP